jgi:hypothetical protein
MSLYSCACPREKLRAGQGPAAIRADEPGVPHMEDKKLWTHLDTIRGCRYNDACKVGVSRLTALL